MPIDLTCSCGKLLRVADEFAGRTGQCPACGALMPIPDPCAALTDVPPRPAATAQALTTTPEWERPAEPGSPGYAASPLPSVSEVAAAEPVEFARPAYRLFSPGVIAAVAFLAGPVGAFILMTLNYWRLGRRHAACAAAILGTLLVGGLAVVSGLLSHGVPSFLLAVPVFLVVWWAAQTLQGDAYETHVKQGGRPASGWAAAGYAVLGLGMYFGAAVMVAAAVNVAFNAGYGPKIDFGHGQEVYYTKGATEADARALGNFLRRVGFFDGENPAAVRVSRDGNWTVISFIVQPWAVHDAEAQDALRQMGRRASQEAFGGRPVRVAMCDDQFKVKKRL